MFNFERQERIDAKRDEKLYRARYNDSRKSIEPFGVGQPPWRVRAAGAWSRIGPGDMVGRYNPRRRVAAAREERVSGGTRGGGGG